MFLSIRKVSCHILTFTLILLAPLTAQAALVTSISALDVSGTSYDVTFYVETSFMQIWDADGDWIFAEGDASIVQAAPVFWGDQTGAQSAAEALAGYLSTVHWTQVYGGSNRDYITVPYSYSDNTVRAYLDNSWFLGTDTISNGGMYNSRDAYDAVYAVFTPTAVPVPSALLLLGSSLIGLVGLRRKFNK